MHLFGLTGGIASGKSSVSSLLEELDCPIIDADVIAREGCFVVVVVVVVVIECFFAVVEPGKPALKRIVEQFGEEVLLEDGRLDRKKLGAIIFENETKRRILNQCTHPYIQKAMLWQVVSYFLTGNLGEGGGGDRSIHCNQGNQWW